MRSYRVGRFDRFDTLVNCVRDCLPLVCLQGTATRTTSLLVNEIVKPVCPADSLEDVLGVL